MVANRKKSLARTLLSVINNARPPRVRSMREFAEQEVVLATGDYADERFKCDRQPLSRLWFDAVDSGQFNRYAVIGPQQSGKTTIAFTIPILYHLFEMRETCILAAPDMNIANDKWWIDLAPIVEASRFSHLMPARGEGSKGGKVRHAVHFANGAVLRFMTAKGDDKSRSHFTSRIAIITEADGMTRAASTSMESGPISQIEGRTRVFSDRKQVFLESTVTIEDGLIWQEYIQGTRSRIMVQCPHKSCRGWIRPERDHLHGWQDAGDVVTARINAHFCCPECGKPITEEQRADCMRKAILLHRGQRIDRRGRVKGPMPNTNTIGFRWSAFDNLLVPAADAAEAEWRGSRSVDEDAAERELCQFVWAIPYKPSNEDVTELTVTHVQNRTARPGRGIVPAGISSIGLGMDIGKRLAHWVLVGLCDDETPHVIDYSVIEIPADDLGPERALAVALADFYEQIVIGYPFDRDDERLLPDQWLIDSGYEETRDVVYAFAREHEEVLPAKGSGSSQYRGSAYKRPMKVGPNVRYIGEEYHIARIAPNRRGQPRVTLVHVNADHWKRRVHSALRVPIEREDKRGRPIHVDAGSVQSAMTLFDAEPKRHLTFAKHMTAEREREEFMPGKGMMRVFEQISRHNHWLDAVSLAWLAARMVEDRAVRSTRARTSQETIDASEWYGEPSDRGRRR